MTLKGKKMTCKAALGIFKIWLGIGGRGKNMSSLGASQDKTNFSTSESEFSNLKYNSFEE